MDIPNLPDFDDSALLSCWGDEDDDGGEGEGCPSSSTLGPDANVSMAAAACQIEDENSATSNIHDRVSCVGGGVNAGGLLYNPLNSSKQCKETIGSKNQLPRSRLDTGNEAQGDLGPKQQKDCQPDPQTGPLTYGMNVNYPPGNVPILVQADLGSMTSHQNSATNASAGGPTHLNAITNSHDENTWKWNPNITITQIATAHHTPTGTPISIPLGSTMMSSGNAHGGMSSAPVVVNLPQHAAVATFPQHPLSINVNAAVPAGYSGSATPGMSFMSAHQQFTSTITNDVATCQAPQTSTHLHQQQQLPSQQHTQTKGTQQTCTGDGSNAAVSTSNSGSADCISVTHENQSKTREVKQTGQTEFVETSASPSFPLFNPPCELRMNFEKSQQASMQCQDKAEEGSQQNQEARRAGQSATSGETRTRNMIGAANNSVSSEAENVKSRHLARFPPEGRAVSSTPAGTVAAESLAAASNDTGGCRSTSTGNQVQYSSSTSQSYRSNFDGLNAPSQCLNSVNSRSGLMCATGAVDIPTHLPKNTNVCVNGPYGGSPQQQPIHKNQGVAPPSANGSGGSIICGVPYQVPSSGSHFLSPPLPPQSSSGPMIDHKAQMLKERNEREQRRAQKITELIDSLRMSMQEGGWKVELKSKFHTLSQSRDYIRHLKKVTKEKEEEVQKAREDLERLQKREKEMFLSEGGSDPESVMSSLTCDSMVKSSSADGTTSGGSSGNTNGHSTRSDGRSRSRSRGEEYDDDDKDDRQPDPGNARAMLNLSRDCTMAENSCAETERNVDKRICGDKVKDESSEPNRGEHQRDGKQDQPKHSNQMCPEKQPHSIKIAKQSSMSDMTANKDETDSNVAICEAILKGGTSTTSTSNSTSRNKHHYHRRHHHNEFTHIKNVEIVKRHKKRKQAGSSKSTSSKKSRRTKSSLDADFKLNYRDVFLTSNIPQLIATATGRIVTWNNFFLKVTGLTADELRCLTIFSIVQADKLSSLFEIVATALRSSNKTKCSSSTSSGPSDDVSDLGQSKGSCPSSNTEGSSAALVSCGGSTGGASGDGEGSTDKEHLTGSSTTASSSTCSSVSNTSPALHDCGKKKRVRLLDYSTVTLPCVDFSGVLRCIPQEDNCTPGTKGVDQPCNKEQKRRQIFMTVTLMDDKDPQKRCFHCALTDCPGMDGALGSITPQLLARIFSADPCPSVITED